MKQSLKMSALFILCINPSLFSAPPSLLTEGAIDVFHFKLNNDKPYCQLSIQYPDPEDSIAWFSLSSQSPCYFFADHQQNQIQTYSYKDSHIEHILLMGGTTVKLTDQQRKNKKIPIDSYCTQNIQALTIKAGKIKLGSVKTTSFACAEDRLDEKLYRQMSEQPQVDIEVLIKEQKEKSSKVEVPFWEDLHQKIEAIFD
jgi:hypothetical protein